MLTRRYQYGAFDVDRRIRRIEALLSYAAVFAVFTNLRQVSAALRTFFVATARNGMKCNDVSL